MSDTRLATPSPAEVAVVESRLSARLYDWVSRVTQRVNGASPVRVPSYTVATLPAAADWPRCLVVVTDDVDGETLAFSDGSTWRRATDLDEVVT